MNEPFFGCIGRHLKHSYSKEIHALLAPYGYELYEVEPDNLGSFISSPSLGGVNVTIPYKREIMKYLDVISPDAAAVGAVNTVVRRDGRLYGFNTDVYGMKRLIRENGIDLCGKKTLILGTGGTSLTALAAADSLGAAEKVRVSRFKKDGAVTYDEMLRFHSDAEIIINTTPVGMFPCSTGAVPAEPSLFNNTEGVIDVIYNPLRTALVVKAQAMGIPACGGLSMLVFQAVKAAEIFTGLRFSEERGEELYKKIYASKCNIVLSGMPSSGKTTTGKVLAKKLGRDFYDTDELIEKEENLSVSEIFAKYGEEYFRDAETRIIKNLGEKTGIVIATGGGSVLCEENVISLKANGRIFFLDREPNSLLPSNTRPLAPTPDAIKALYEKRISTYLSTADARIIPDKEPCVTAEAIIKEMNRAGEQI